MICNRCGKDEIVQSLGTSVLDNKYFPKYLCNNCVKEWRNALYKQPFYKSGKDYEREWAKFFKQWLGNKPKERVNFT